jgi:hypothetical protein
MRQTSLECNKMAQFKIRDLILGEASAVRWAALLIVASASGSPPMTI